MGFYGNSYFEFSKMFSKFQFRNDGLTFKEPVDQSKLSSDTTIWQVADERWATLHFYTKNAWITLEPFKEEEVGTDGTSIQIMKGVRIGHGAPTKAEYFNKGFNIYQLPEKEEDKPKDIINLNAGDILCVPDLNFDSAGHFVYPTKEKPQGYQYYIMPKNAIMIEGLPQPPPEIDEEGNEIYDTEYNIIRPREGILHFETDDWLKIEKVDKGNGNSNLKLHHEAKLSVEYPVVSLNTIGIRNANEVYDSWQDNYPSAEQQQLKAGDQIVTYLTRFDATGHAIGIEERRYVLPVTESELELQSLKNQVTELELQVSYKANNSTVGNFSDLYGNVEGNINLHPTFNFTNITSAIGNLQATTLKVNSEAERTLSIAEMFEHLAKIITALDNNNNTYDLALKALENELEALKARIKELEDLS